MTSDTSLKAHLIRQGYEFLAAERGSDLFERLISSSESDIICSRFNLPRFVALREQQKLVGDLTQKLQNYTADAAQDIARDKISYQDVEDGVLQSLAIISKKDKLAIKLNQGFMEMGVDSLMLQEFLLSLEDRFSFTLETTVLFDYSTPKNLAGYIYKVLSEQALLSVQENESGVEMHEQQVLAELKQELECHE